MGRNRRFQGLGRCGGVSERTKGGAVPLRQIAGGAGATGTKITSLQSAGNCAGSDRRSGRTRDHGPGGSWAPGHADESETGARFRARAWIAGQDRHAGCLRAGAVRGAHAACVARLAGGGTPAVGGLGRTSTATHVAACRGAHASAPSLRTATEEKCRTSYCLLRKRTGAVRKTTGGVGSAVGNLEPAGDSVAHRARRGTQDGAPIASPAARTGPRQPPRDRAALVGLAPFACDSGHWRGKRRIQGAVAPFAPFFTSPVGAQCAFPEACGPFTGAC